MNNVQYWHISILEITNISGSHKTSINREQKS